MRSSNRASEQAVNPAQAGIQGFCKIMKRLDFGFQAYRARVMQGVAEEELDSMRLYLQRQHACGSDRFRTAIEAQLRHGFHVDDPLRSHPC